MKATVRATVLDRNMHGFLIGVRENFRGDEARRVFEAMMPMKKIDVATIEAARRG